MIKSEAAIDTAVTFLKKLNPVYLGGEPKDIRLETIQLFDKEWVVILSYTILTPRPEKGPPDAGIPGLVNSLSELLSSRRYFKEFETDAQSGEVTAMRNPQAPATTYEPQVNVKGNGSRNVARITGAKTANRGTGAKKGANPALKRAAKI